MDINALIYIQWINYKHFRWLTNLDSDELQPLWSRWSTRTASAAGGQPWTPPGPSVQRWAVSPMADDVTKQKKCRKRDGKWVVKPCRKWGNHPIICIFTIQCFGFWILCCIFFYVGNEPWWMQGISTSLGPFRNVLALFQEIWGFP